MRRAPLALWAITGVGLVATLGSSCITKGYPLGASGNVGFIKDVATSLFAGSLDSNGQLATARQKPFETRITLNMSEGGDPAYGAYVDVRVEPAEALVLSSADGEAGGPTCEETDGNFRCTASKDGVAQFIASSESTWSGDAHVLVSWASATGVDQVINIAPAGLPGSDIAKNFELVIGGVSGTPGDVAGLTIAPSFVELACSVNAKPGNSGTSWPAGKVRTRIAHARVTRPGDSADIVENAPVLIEALDSESALSPKTDPKCGDANRTSRLQLNMDATGQTDEFYVCFSDNGGPVRFAVSSGVQSIERDLVVDPEPYLIRVKTEPKAIPQGLSPQSIFTIDAFDLNLQPLKMTVDLASSNDAVLQLLPNGTTVDTAAAGETPTLVSVIAVALGTAQLQVTPLLLAKPECLSDIVTVEAPTP